MQSNPYTDQTFFSFFGVLIKRFALFISGKVPIADLAPDEIQILVLAAVAISGALLGTFLVLRRMTMLANALSHTILLGIVLLYLICGGATNSFAFFGASLLTALFTTFLTEFFTRSVNLQEDASIGLIFTTLFAGGIALLSFFLPNTHLGSEVVMGNVDALQREDLKIVLSTLLANAALFFLFFKEFTLTTFDGNLAESLGFSPRFYNYFLMVMTSATAIAAFRAVGVLMVLAFFVAPVLTARLLTHRLSRLIALAMGLGLAAAALGVALSRHLLTVRQIGLSTGGIVVTLLSLFFLLAIPLRKGLMLRGLFQRRDTKTRRFTE